MNTSRHIDRHINDDDGGGGGGNGIVTALTATASTPTMNNSLSRYPTNLKVAYSNSKDQLETDYIANQPNI